jgi:peptide/nickel transport system ATP-binding protein
VGCRFQARCAKVHALPPGIYRLAEIRPGHQAACHLHEAAEEQPDLPIHLDKAAGC